MRQRVPSTSSTRSAGRSAASRRARSSDGQSRSMPTTRGTFRQVAAAAAVTASDLRAIRADAGPRRRSRGDSGCCVPPLTHPRSQPETHPTKDAPPAPRPRSPQRQQPQTRRRRCISSTWTFSSAIVNLRDLPLGRPRNDPRQGHHRPVHRHKLPGVNKPLWLILLLLLPLLAPARHHPRGNGSTAVGDEPRRHREDNPYKPAASSSPTDDIAQAKALLDAGSISQGEFEALKSKALGKQYFG